MMKIKQKMLVAAIAATAALGNSCSEASNNTPIQVASPPNPAPSLEQHDDSHSQDNQSQSKESAPEGHNNTTHHHASLEVSTAQPIPTVDLIVHEDTVMGWNLEIQVSNFRFAPENINQESKTYEGHAHLYINGKKSARLYSPWSHLASLEPGENKIKVTLNGNGHESLIHQGKEIADTEIIQVPASE